MFANVLRFVLLVLFGLLVGTMFVIWVGYNSASLSAVTYVEQQQNAIRALNTLLALMGALCILISISLAVLSKQDPPIRYLYLCAAVFMVVAALVTRFGNQPINAVVMSWSPQSPAANWSELRDQWWQWHIVRSVAGVSALVLITLAVVAAKPRHTATAA